MKKVFVAMSGGVDSSVAAAFLKRAGYGTVGVFIRAFEAPGTVCAWREERRDAMRAAARLGLPLITIDFSREYEREVVKLMVDEYRAGRTPNPDVECNRAIKFGAFYRFARRRGADFIATGHYVRLRRNRLWQARDKNKDQSYFLWTLVQHQLKHCLFPIGEYIKPQVRRLAEKFGLPNAGKKDSQGLCFVGQLDFKDFLKQVLKPRPGQVVDKAGRVIGHHDGAALYTIGERRGFVVQKGGGPHYVVDKKIDDNVLMVAPSPPRVVASAGAEIIIAGVNWVSGKKPSPERIYQARVRHRGELVPCRLTFSGEIAGVHLQKQLFAVAPGQSLVLYRDEELLGGGVVDKINGGL